MDLLQEDDGQVSESLSISAEFAYLGTGLEHSYVYILVAVRNIQQSLIVKLSKQFYRGRYSCIRKFTCFSSCHEISTNYRNKLIVACLSGRRDKEVQQIKEMEESA